MEIGAGGVLSVVVVVVVEGAALPGAFVSVSVVVFCSVVVVVDVVPGPLSGGTGAMGALLVWGSGAEGSLELFSILCPQPVARMLPTKTAAPKSFFI